MLPQEEAGWQVAYAADPDPVCPYGLQPLESGHHRAVVAPVQPLAERDPVAVHPRPSLCLWLLLEPLIRKESPYLARAVLHAKAEGERLEAAGVGEQWLLEAHESVQAAHLPNNFSPWTEVEMVGVGQRDLYPQVVQILRR